MNSARIAVYLVIALFIWMVAVLVWMLPLKVRLRRMEGAVSALEIRKLADSGNVMAKELLRRQRWLAPIGVVLACLLFAVRWFL